MSSHAPALTSLIGSRICHDLISPIGAITNGLELLSLTGGAPGPELTLIGDSVESVSARIKFFRIAYGVAGEERLARSDVLKILEDLGKSGRIKILWDVEGDARRSDVRLVFLALQCVETALAYGGCATVTSEGGHWRVDGRAERIKVDPDLWTDFASPPDKSVLTPANVQFALLPVIARETGLEIRVDTGEDHVAICF